MDTSPAPPPQEDIDIPAMFDGIAQRYDFLNRLLTLGMDRRWRRHMVAGLGLKAGDRVLDLACGTGDVAAEILRRRPGSTVVGADPAAEMLRLAKIKVPAMETVRCPAEQLPFPKASFDAITVAFGLRNFADRGLGLAEIKRVLRPAGQLAVLEFARPHPGPLHGFYRWYLGSVLPFIGGLLSQSAAYRYLPDSIDAFPPPDELTAEMGRIGLELAERRSWLGGTVWYYRCLRK